MSLPAIQVENLTKSYGPLTVFENLAFSVAPGERVALVGASGAGKSTILHLLGGLDRATSGQIRLDGEDVTALSEPALAALRNRKIGFVWQIASLLPEFTAEENVAMPLLIRGEHQRKAMEKAAALLDEVGLAGRRHHRAGELSGGEQQRVSLARALVAEPRFLLADEPTGSLDYRTAEKIVSLLETLHERHRLTSVYVTHSEEFAGRCHRVLELDKGRLREGRMPDRMA